LRSVNYTAHIKTPTEEKHRSMQREVGLHSDMPFDNQNFRVPVNVNLFQGIQKFEKKLAQ
jgi:hypothetical protein